MLQGQLGIGCLTSHGPLMVVNQELLFLVVGRFVVEPVEDLLDLVPREGILRLLVHHGGHQVGRDPFVVLLRSFNVAELVQNASKLEQRYGFFRIPFVGRGQAVAIGLGSSSMGLAGSTLITGLQALALKSIPAYLTKSS